VDYLGNLAFWNLMSRIVVIPTTLYPVPVPPAAKRWVVSLGIILLWDVRLCILSAHMSCRIQGIRISFLRVLASAWTGRLGMWKPYRTWDMGIELRHAFSCVDEG